jgi:hypothetical protein
VLHIHLFISQKKGVSILVSGRENRYPGTPMTIRVDENKAISGGKSFSASSIDILLKQMSAGSIIQARYSEWPYNTYIDGRTDAEGIAEAIIYCRANVK